MPGYEPSDLQFPDLANSFPDPEFSVIRSGDGSVKQSPWQFYSSPLVDDGDETCYNPNSRQISGLSSEESDMY